MLIKRVSSDLIHRDGPKAMVHLAYGVTVADNENPLIE